METIKRLNTYMLPFVNQTNYNEVMQTIYELMYTIFDLEAKIKAYESKNELKEIIIDIDKKIDHNKSLEIEVQSLKQEILKKNYEIENLNKELDYIKQNNSILLQKFNYNNV